MIYNYFIKASLSEREAENKYIISEVKYDKKIHIGKSDLHRGFCK